MNYLMAGGTLLFLGLLLYARYQVASLRADAANVAPLAQALHDQKARTSALEAEIAGLHAKTREIDEAEAREVLASGDPARVVGFMRRSFPDSK